MSPPALQEAPARPETVVLEYAPRGSSLDLFHRRDPEVVIAGPAGTGKSRGALEKVHLCAMKYDGMRGLLLRKTHRDLAGSALVTYNRKVLHPLDGVRFFGGSANEPPAFRYPNGSELLVGGLEKPTKVMSKEYDLIYVNEATELLLEDWEAASSRLRNWVMPYQQILGDCNPDSPYHWIKVRADDGRLALLDSRHEDNPELFDEAGAITERGQDYITRLDALSGVRYLRLRKGIWAAAEGVVYEDWDRAAHVVDDFPVPKDWSRYWAVDFGYTNPFVWQAWAADPDGRLYLYRELYATHGLVEDHARRIAALTAGEPAPRMVVCDHDAEDRATLERHLGVGTVPADKRVSTGVQAVQARLRKAGDGRPRLFLLRSALDTTDPLLAEARRPTRTEQEFDGYVWDTRNNRKRGEEPMKNDDHGMDALRYLVMGVDSYNPVAWY